MKTELKKKIIVLKSVAKEKKESDESNAVNEDKEMALIIKKFRRFIKNKKKQGYKKKLFVKEE